MDTLLDQLDGKTPRLEAISNPAYGSGVIAASVDEDILRVLRISQSSVTLLTSVTEFPGVPGRVSAFDIRFDRTGLFENQLYVSVIMDMHFETTRRFYLAIKTDLVDKARVATEQAMKNISVTLLSHRAFQK